MRAADGGEECVQSGSPQVQQGTQQWPKRGGGKSVCERERH